MADDVTSTAIKDGTIYGICTDMGICKMVQNYCTLHSRMDMRQLDNSFAMLELRLQAEFD